jgi:ABC-type dipeptide/oligopeptide/nickel transport system permease component
MLTQLLRRLLLIPLVLALVNCLAFAYAHTALYVQYSLNPYGTVRPPPDVPVLYGEYGAQVLRGDFGVLPVGAGAPLLTALVEAAGKSAGLLLIALTVSVGVGLLMGISAVSVNPPRIAPWLAPFTSTGLAMPSFYIGTLFVAASVQLALRGVEQFPIPLSGFGWDAHLLLPVLALMIRPTMQIAQVTASLLADEARKQYVVTARSVGNTWRTIRRKHTLRNILAAVVLTITGAFRLSLAELVLVEWLFVWPGVGRMLALTLIAPNVAGPGTLTGAGQFFLNPQLLTALVTLFAALFLIADFLAFGLVRAADPRLRSEEGGA